MSNTISLICEVILIFLIGWHFIYAYISKDRALMWSPITTIALTYFYYVSVPFWGGTIEKYQVDEDLYNGYLFHIATLLSYIFILIGFYKSGSGKTNFKKWNSYFTEENSGKMGMLRSIQGTAFIYIRRVVSPSNGFWRLCVLFYFYDQYVCCSKFAYAY